MFNNSTRGLGTVRGPSVRPCVDGPGPVRRCVDGPGSARPRVDGPGVRPELRNPQELAKEKLRKPLSAVEELLEGVVKA